MTPDNQIESLPIAQKAVILAKQWQITQQLAERFLILETKVAELSKKA